MKKNAIILSLGLVSMNAFSAEVPIATDTGTITIKGTAYAAACSLSSSGAAQTLTIPTTFAADYKKGDMSPQTTSQPIVVTCTGSPARDGVYFTVTGDADSLDPSLFKVADGSGKATGIALKLSAKSAYDAGDITDIIPNKESALLPKSSSSNQIAWYYLAQAVSVADKVTSGDLSTNLTWTARYN